jgi:formamidopyrimidine-DNA glycosylase
MPELPEVETVCRGLNKLTLAQPILNAEVLLERTLAYPDDTTIFVTEIAGKAIAQWQRRGKYLLACLEKEQGYLGVHLRMTGQLLWVDKDTPLPKHTRLRWFFPDNQELRFVDTRTFGKVWWIPPSQSPEALISGLNSLGVEPLSAEFTPDYLQAKLKLSGRSIKTFLLDQTIIAGIGNIYADEALFKSSILPHTSCRLLKPSHITRLHTAIQEVLTTAINAGGTTFSDFLQVTGVNGNYGGMAWVYGRFQQPCRVCGSLVERIKLGGRSSHFCPRCQS